MPQSCSSSLTGLTDAAMKRVVTAAQVAHAPVIIGVDPAYSRRG
ncbi:Uncharacterised protein [Kluyvera cryocrescens]|uniref:Uncharacterized protein n=1 Tax=Kluyvera cryocrescens TaxID=580 RepID=A0A485B630_KLUCR|nr:Uncharacterised protein [Kluyvera cryocrescens]